LPFVIQNTHTLQLYTCLLVNHYQLVYYGVKYWEILDGADQQARAFLQEKGVSDIESWNVIEIEEGQMKICNVKLKNDPQNVVYWLETKKAEVRRN
jgi:hypothetical protein